MVGPSGFTALGLVGFTDKGPYNSAATYVANDLVTYDNNKWRCLVDDTSGITPSEGLNWTIFIRSSTNLSGTNAIDTEGLIGTAGANVTGQELVDEIAERLVDGHVITAKRRTFTVNAPVADSAHAGYTHKQAFAWTGVTAGYSGDAVVSSGTYEGNIALETGTDTVTLYFSDFSDSSSATPPNISVTVTVFPSDTGNLPA